MLLPILSELINFYFSRNHQKNYVFLVISEGIEVNPQKSLENTLVKVLFSTVPVLQYVTLSNRILKIFRAAILWKICD